MSDSRALIRVPTEALAEFCRANQIARLSFFGSVLREDFTPDSDVDVLVEFEPGASPGLIRLAGMELELGELLSHKVDLVTLDGLSKYIKPQVLEAAEEIYVAT